MMKKRSASVCKLMAIITICASVLCISGCLGFNLDGGYFAQPGETVAEGHRRHIRNLSINQQNMMADLDRAGLIDQPSKAHIIKID